MYITKTLRQVFGFGQSTGGLVRGVLTWMRGWDLHPKTRKSKCEFWTSLNKKNSCKWSQPWSYQCIVVVSFKHLSTSVFDVFVHSFNNHYDVIYNTLFHPSKKNHVTLASQKIYVSESLWTKNILGKFQSQRHTIRWLVVPQPRGVSSFHLNRLRKQPHTVGCKFGHSGEYSNKLGVNGNQPFWIILTRNDGFF